MKIARYREHSVIRLGIVEGERVIALSGRLRTVSDDMIELIKQWPDLVEQVEALRGESGTPTSEVEFLAPVPRPGKIWGIGLNYAAHREEAEKANMELPTRQSWFVMAQTTVAGPYQPIPLPSVSTALDYEAEMVFIIGKGGRHIAEADAADHIFGYCAGNDVSVRDYQFHSSQFCIGKSFDGHAPFGPWIVTPDEIDPANLPIRCFVNGEKRQDSNTRNLIFTPAQQIAYLSEAMTLEPGDVLFTGTPGGVGGAMSPPNYLKAGDIVRVEIDGLGYIENEVVDEVVV